MNDDQSTVVTLKVRVTPEFREKIVSTAKQNNRSMNQEIVARLEQSFAQSSQGEISELKQQLERMDQTIKTLATTLHVFSTKQGGS